MNLQLLYTHTHTLQGCLIRSGLQKASISLQLLTAAPHAAPSYVATF